MGHDWIYDSQYYARDIEGPAVRSATSIAKAIRADLAPSSVVDVGCGTGALLARFRDLGCEVFGFEYSEAGLKYCRERQLDVAKFDLETDTFAGSRSFDVAI